MPEFKSGLELHLIIQSVHLIKVNILQQLLFVPLALALLAFLGHKNCSDLHRLTFTFLRHGTAAQRDPAFSSWGRCDAELSRSKVVMSRRCAAELSRVIINAAAVHYGCVSRIELLLLLLM